MNPLAICREGFLYGTKIYNLLDFSGNGCLNTLDFILIWSYGLMVYIFVRTVKSKKNKDVI